MSANTTIFTDHHIAEMYIAALSEARSNFLKLHQKLSESHPDWELKHDARTNLLAKPINLIQIAIVNMRLLQDRATYVEFWTNKIDTSLNTLEAAYPSYFEWNTFYRYGFYQFLLSNIEHGFRAIHPKVVVGEEGYTDYDFIRVYSSLFAKVLLPDRAETHTLLFDFLRLLRNTIHNNGVYYPRNQRDLSFTIAGRTYILTVGRRIDYFSWENFIEWLEPILEAIADTLSAPAVLAVEHISDIASHA